MGWRLSSNRYPFRRVGAPVGECSLIMRVLLLVLLAALAGCNQTANVPKIALEPPPHALAHWPWANAELTHPFPGVARWFDHSSADSTTVELMRFDFHKRLRFELYDQDEDDATPFDDRVDYYPVGIGQVTKHLNQIGRGPVVAAWNGLFFAYDRRGNAPHGLAQHIGSVVLKGKVHYNTGNFRWAFGVKYHGVRAEFNVIHEPDRKTLEREFYFGAIGAQCLIEKGRPKKLQPFPKPGAMRLPQPVPSTRKEAGHIPLVDHMRTSRTSMAWSKDSRYLYLLVVNAPETENASKLALLHGGAIGGGWTLADLQRFWLSFGAWGSVNSDGGAVTQLVFLRRDGRYEMLPPRIAAPNQRLLFDRNLESPPQGGTLMTFFVRSMK